MPEGAFVVLCGMSGCGKTTLLRLLKKTLAPHGTRTGDIRFRGTALDELSERTAAFEIGYVMQDPEAQIVTDRVWHEMSFAAENLGIPTEQIRIRVGETANYFGMDDWFTRDSATLSGGQKQLLALASIMTLSPSLLLLDEPTSQLDPVAAAHFLHTLYRINRELGVTVILAEHRLEDAMPLADLVIAMEDGRIIAFDKPRNVCKKLENHPMFVAFPAAARICSALNLRDEKEEFPLTVREGRDAIRRMDARRAPPSAQVQYPCAVDMRGVWFRYERAAPDVLRGVSLRAGEGEVLSLLGGNGTGKTTLLHTLAGVQHPYRGKILLFGKPLSDYRGTALHRHNVALLPQNVSGVFLRDSVRADLTDICRVMGQTPQQAQQNIARVCEKLSVLPLLNRHPYDLSGGEMQKCALAKILLTEPRVLLLDEPTKGIDACAKRVLLGIIRALAAEGVCVLTVTHDVEFAALVSDRVALFFDGEVIGSAPPATFFAENRFYTTAASRIGRGRLDGAVTVESLVALAGGEGHV